MSRPKSIGEAHRLITQWKWRCEEQAEEITELKQQLDEANAQLHGYSAMSTTILSLRDRLALHDAEVIEKAIKECSHKYDEYSWDNILGYAQQLRDSVKEWSDERIPKR